jgi:hypothetical protein
MECNLIVKLIFKYKTYDQFSFILKIKFSKGKTNSKGGGDFEKVFEKYS